MKRVLLVGASSILGNAVVRELEKQWELDVFALGGRDDSCLDSGPITQTNINWLEIECEDILNLQIGYPSKFDLIIVCLGYISDPQNQFEASEMIKSFKLNVFFPVQIVNLYLEADQLAKDCTILFFSTALVSLPGFQKSFVYSNFKKQLENLVLSLQKNRWRDFNCIFIRPGYVPTKINQHLGKGLFPSTPEVLAKRVSKSLIGGKHNGVIYSPVGLGILIRISKVLPSSLKVKLVYCLEKIQSRYR